MLISLDNARPVTIYIQDSVMAYGGYVLPNHLALRVAPMCEGDPHISLLGTVNRWVLVNRHGQTYAAQVGPGSSHQTEQGLVVGFPAYRSHRGVEDVTEQDLPVLGYALEIAVNRWQLDPLRHQAARLDRDFRAANVHTPMTFLTGAPAVEE